MARLAILSRAERTAWFTEHNALERLRQAGHSAFKAFEIKLAFERGDRYAIGWTLAVIGE